MKNFNFANKMLFSFRKSTSALMLFLLFSTLGNAQPWTYDFGTGTGSYTSATASTTFLANPPAGTDYVRVGTNPGSITMANPGLAGLGSGTELQITSNTVSASTTKFSVYDYTGATAGYTKFKLSLAGGTDGVYNFWMGNGAFFSNNTSATNTEIFAGLRWTLGASNTVSYSVSNAAGAFVTSGLTNPTTLFTQSTSTTYLVEIYGNNTAAASNYNKSGTNYSLAANTWDLWVDGVRVGTNLAKAGITSGTTFDSFAFNHQASATAPGTIYIDDIEYSNALPQGINVNGSIGTNEYGTHTNGNNQQSTGSGTWYSNHDATNLYFGVDGGNINEAGVVYLDFNPIVPLNGGTNANGNLTGFNYDGSSFANLQFRADIVMYFKNGYAEYRLADGSGGWGSGITTGISNAASGSVREFSIPWSAMGGLPASYNWFGYIAYSGGGAYGSVPTENPGSGGGTTIGASARWPSYFTVSTTTVGSSTPPFSRNSYTFTESASNNSFGGISVWDFTMNTSGLQIARLNSGGDWTINNSLVVGAGTVFFGSGGSGYGQSNIANIDIRGGSLNMDQTNKVLNTTGNFVMSSGSFFQSGTIGGDFNLGGNWTISGGSYTPNNRAVTFNGTAAQTLAGATTFDFLTINNTSGLSPAVTFNSSVVANQQLTLTAGRLRIGANNLTVSSATAGAISGGSSTAFVETNSTGTLRRTIPTAGFPLTFNFPVGTGTTYAPASFNFSANNTARNLHVRSIAGTHPANGTPTNFIANRYWNSDLSSSAGTYSYTSQFTFQGGDVNGTIGSIKLGKYNGSIWTDDAGSSASGTVLSSGTLTETTGSLAATADWAGRTSPAATSLSASALTAFGSVCINTTTAENSFTITGTALTTANVTVSALSGYTFSTTAGGTYTSSLSLVQVGGSYSQIIYVRFSPTAAISYNGNIAIGGGGATSINVAAAGSGINTAPAVTTTAATAVTSSTASSGGSGITSACGTITSRGVVWGLSANPTIPSANSTSDGTGTVTYTSSISGLTSGTLYNYRSYVTNSNGLTSYGTNLTFTTLKNEPTNYPTSFACGTTTSTTIPLTWADASGGQTPDGYLIRWSATSYAAIADPVDGTTIANGATAQNVAQGVQSHTATGLTGATTYFFKIWSYTNSGTNINYKLVSEPQTSCATLIAPVSILTFEFAGIAGDEVSAASNFNNPNLTNSLITRGTGLTANGNADRFNATNWALTSIANAVSTNNYMEFTITPSVGYQFNVSSITLSLQRSGTGPSALALRNSLDSYSSNLDAVYSIVDNTSTQSFTFTFSQTNSTSPVTYRVYMYAEATAGSGGIGDFTGNDINVFGNVSSLGTITTGTVSTSLCAGASSVSVPFTYTPAGNFPNGVANFTAQLSDAAGSFASPVTLQSVTSDGSGSQSISATIPALTSTGSGYRIRVVSASPGVNGSNNASNISISNTATSIAPTILQNISTSTNGTTLTVTEGATFSARIWKYGTVSGVYGTSTGITTSTYTPNFVLPGTYYIVCETTYPAPCSNVVTTNEVQVNVVGSVDYTWNGSVSANWSNSSNWTPNGVPIIDDNVTINVPGTNTLIVTDSRSINSLTVSGTGTFQLTSSGALSVNGNITSSIAGSPTFDCASTFSILNSASQTIPSWNYGNLTASGGARVLSSTGTIGICGTFTPGAGAYTNTGSTVNFNGTGAQTVNAINYNNLSIAGAHTTNNITLPAGSIGVSGSFLSTATFSTGAYSNTGNTIDYNGTGAQTVAAFPSYNNLTISGARASATVTLASGTIGVAGTFNPSATAVTYASTGNTFDYTSSGSQTIAIFSQYNNLSNSGNGARTLANGIIAVYGTYTPTTAAITVGTSTVDFAGTSGQTIPASFYYNITNSSNTNRTWANAGIIDIKNTFTPTSVTNTITGSTIQYSATSGTLNLTTITTNVASRNYNNLIFSGTGGTWSLNGNTIGVANDLTVSAGILLLGSSAGAGTLNVDGIFTVNGGSCNTTNTTTAGTINLFGNLTVSSGTFTKSGSGVGTVNLIKSTGTQIFSQSGGTISNANAWNFGNGTTANTIQIASNVSASTGVFNINTGTTVDFGTNTLTVTSGAFNLNSGATLNTTNASGITTAGATGSILRSSGSNTFSASANYIFGGAITGTGFTGANNLTINNASGVTLSAAATVNGALTFTNGLLDIAAVNLTIGSTGSIAGANTAKYVKTSGAGQLKMTVAASNVLFPVGRSAYNPLTLNNSGTSDVFGVVLADAISQSLNNSSLVVNRSWNITETTAGGSSLSIVSQWNGAAEQAAGFAAGTTPRIAYWNGSAWVQTGAAQAGANPFTFTSTANLSGIASATYSIAIGKDDAFICTAAPTVSLVLPTSGYSGDVITINGTGLSGLTGATIGGTAATIVSQFGTSATLAVGAGATGVITVSKSPVCSASSASSFTFLGFVSAQTGDWNLGSTWQGGVVPPSGSAVTILNSHNVTLNVNAASSGVTINSGGTLTLNNATNTLNLGAGTLLVNGTLSVTAAVNAATAIMTAGTLNIGTGGTFTNSAGNARSISVTTFNVNSGATYNHDALGSSTAGATADFPGLTGGANITINSNATINFTKWGIAAQSPPSAPTVVSGQWGNLTINIASQIYSGSWQNSGAIPNATSLNILATGSRDFRLTTANSNYTGTFGSINVSGGILSLCSGGSTGAGTIVLNVSGNTSISGGNLSIHGSAGSSDANTSSVTANFNGNVSITGGAFYCLASNSSFITYASGNTVVNFNGNLDISNATFDHAFLPAYITPSISTGAVSVNLKGNFNLGSGSTLRSSNSINTGRATTTNFNFNKTSGTQTFDESGTVSNHAIAYTVSGTSNTLLLNTAADLGNSALGSLIVNSGTTLDCGANVLSAGGTFTAQSGSTLKLGNANGITNVPTANGNIQFTTARNFNAATNYTYSGSVNQVTGNGLPSTITGALSIANTGAASNNTVSLTTNGTTASTFNLTSGLFAAGAAQQLNIASGGTVNATSGDFETGANAGILNFPGTGTFTGNSNPYNVYASGGVNFGAGTVTIQPAGAFRINSGGFVNTNAPFYANGSALQYNTTGVFGRNLEWRASSGRGYPHHVQISNSTTLNPGANSNTAQPFIAAGNLTIDAGSNIYMDFGGLNMSVPLTVTGGLNLNGNLSLSGGIGGDINVGGDWTNNGTASNFFANSRAVTFNGSVNQNIGGSNTSSNPFAFVTINNAAGGTLTFGQSVSNTLTFSAGNLSLGIYDLTISPGASISGASSSKFIITNGTGRLIQNLVNNSAAKTYPIGASSSAYTPAILSQTASGVTDNISVRVSSAPAFDNAVNDNAQMIGAQWTINESVAGGNNLVTSFQWPQTTEGASFVRANGVFHGNWTGSSYVVRPTSASSGSDPYTSTSTVNYTSTLSNQPFVLGNINGVLGCFSSTASGSWNSNSTWSSGIVPVSGVSVCLNHNITIGSADPNPDAVLGVTLNGSSTLDVHSTKILTFSNGGALINNSGVVQNIGAGTVLASGVLAISGANSITMGNLTLNGNTTITTSPTISGNLTLNSGAFLTAAPTYGNSSTLIYNTGGSYNVGSEWTNNLTTAGLGVPKNVTINGSFVTMPSSNRGLGGDLTIATGSFDLNSTSGDLYIGGNWTRTLGASFNANNRAVFFNGSSNQTIMVTGGDAETFTYLIVDKSAGNVIIDNTQPSDVAINGDFGNVLQINAGNTFDLNGRNLSLVGTGGNVNLPSGTASITGPAGSKFIIWNGAKTVTPSLGATLNFDSNVTVVLNNGFNFGASTSTINGTLQIANGGFVSSNPPTYATGSTLRYFTGSNFNRGLEWSTNSGPGYPHHVVLDLNSTVTTVNLAPGAATCQVAGNLTVNNGAILNMGAMTNPLVVSGDVTIGGASSGTLSLSSAAGGDIKIAGNLTRNSGGLLTQNSREVEMNGSALQTITGVTTFDFLAVNNSASSVRLTDNSTINNRLRLNNGQFDLNGRTCALTNGSKILRVNGTMSASPSVTGSNIYDLEYQNSVTSSFEYLASSTAVRDLIITAGNTLTLEENRTFNRDLTLSGGDLNLGGFTLTARGRAPAPAFSGSITVSGGGNRTITGIAGSTFDITGLGANLPNDYTKTVSSFGGSSLSFDSNVLVRIGDGAVDFGSGSPTTINGTLQVLLAGSVGQILNPCYYGVNSLLRFSNTVDYQVGSNDKTWTSGAISSGNPGIPYNVEVLDVNTDLQLQSTRALRGNLTITNGTFALTPAYTGSFNIGGNWTRSGATSAFNHNSKKVVFDRQSAGNQTITVSSGVAAETFYDLEVSLLNGNLISASASPITINNNLNFASGKMDIGSNQLTIGTVSTNGTITGEGSSNYVITNSVAGGGNIKAFTNSNATFDFPVGDATNYSPMFVTLTSGAQAGAYITTASVQGVHPNMLTATPPTKYISRYWSVEPSGLTIDPLYDVSFSYVAADEVGVGTLYPVKYSTSTTTPGWQSCPGSTAVATTGTSGSNDPVLRTFSWNGLTTFSDFSGAGDGSPLPVTWLNFDAQFNNATSNVDVSWTTASEINNDYFEVMRSVDALNFEVVGTIDGAGNSSLVKDYTFVDANPLSGLSYYKIRQVDFNGQNESTEIRAVNNNGTAIVGTLFTYPNPLIGQDLTIVYSNLDKGNWEYRLVDITGKIVLAQNRTSDLNAGTFNLNLEQLPAGVYLFQLNTQTQNFTRKITISK